MNNMVTSEWQNDDYYRYTDTHTDKLWAWEFLRRNIDYQKDWQKAYAKYDEDKAKPLAQRPVKSATYYRYTDKDIKFSVVGDDDIYEKWGIHEYHHPCCKTPMLLQLPEGPRFIIGRKHPLYDHIIGGPIPLHPSELAVVINLNRPIEPQIKQAGLQLKSFQKNYPIDVKRPKRRRELWLIYIRVLDAISSGTDRETIAAILFSNPRVKVDEKLRQLKEKFAQATDMAIAGFRLLFDN